MKPNRIKLMAERFFLFDPSIYMNVIFTIDGVVPVEKIRAAIEKTFTQNQTTMSKAVLDEKGNLFLEEMGHTGCCVFADSRDWQEIRREQERIPFRINEGEFLRAFITPRENSTDVYLMAHHMMADGSGLLILVDDIMNNLAGFEVTYKPTEVMKRRDVIRKGDLPFMSRFRLRLLNRLWAKEKRIFTWEDYYQIHETYWKDKSTFFEFTTMEAEEVAALKQECKALGITVNSYLVAKIMKNYPDDHVLGVPVSLRGKSSSISNMITSLMLEYRYDTNKSITENALRAHQIIREGLASEPMRYHIPQFVAILDPTLMDAAVAHFVLGFDSEAARKASYVIGYTSELGTDVGITNLGVLDVKTQYGDYRITNMIGIPPQVSATRRVVSIYTYNGKMTITDTKVKKI